jgi:hypothetical protein
MMRKGRGAMPLVAVFNAFMACGQDDVEVLLCATVSSRLVLLMVDRGTLPHVFMS